MIRFRQYFLTGIAVILPLALTVLVFRYIWNILVSTVVNPVYNVFPFELDKRIAIFIIKGLILIFVVLAVSGIGYMANWILVRKFIQIGESLVSRVPMVNRVYSVLKEISLVFFGKGKQKDLFRSAVLIEYPRKGLYSIAFVTRKSHPVISQKVNQELLSVFLPTTPNPTSGVLLFVPKQDIVDLPISIEDAVKLVISGGSLVSNGYSANPPAGS